MLGTIVLQSRSQSLAFFNDLFAFFSSLMAFVWRMACMCSFALSYCSMVLSTANCISKVSQMCTTTILHWSRFFSGKLFFSADCTLLPPEAIVCEARGEGRTPRREAKGKGRPNELGAKWQRDYVLSTISLEPSKACPVTSANNSMFLHLAR